MAASMNIQSGGVRLGSQPSLRPAVDSEQAIEFAASGSDALWLAFGAAAFAPAAVLAKPSVWRYVIGGVVVFLAAAAVRRAFWRERLMLDLVQRRYTYGHGYWPKITTDEGPLDALKSVVLDVHTESGSRGGEVTRWIVSLVFSDTTLAVANFNTELQGYEYRDALAKRLRIAAIDRTGGTEEKTAWSEVGKPLAARTGTAAPCRQMPPLPEGSRIALAGDAPERKIVLPRPGLRLGYFVYALFPLFPPWFTGTLYDLRLSGPFVAFAALFALIAAMACLANKEIDEAGDSLSFATRLLGAKLSKRSVAKRDIVDVKLKPVPTSASWRRRDELQIRTAGTVLNLRHPTLSGEEMSWLAQALQAMVPAG